MIHTNEYFNGSVKSLAYENNGKSTVGVIEPGEYEFATSTPETMEVLEGEIFVLLPNKSGWERYTKAEKFYIPANSSFKIKVSIASSYLCKYQ